MHHPSHRKRLPLLLALMGLIGLLRAWQSAQPGPLALAQTEPYRSLLPVVRGGGAATEDPLAHLNRYRAQVGLPPVALVPDWGYGCTLHARYTVKTDHHGHLEEPTSPWYTPEGAAAGRSGLLTASHDSGYRLEEAIDRLIAAPFHRFGLLDPQLQAGMGVGYWHEEDGGLQAAYCLNTHTGTPITATSPIPFPQMWPAAGTVVPVHLAGFDGQERPNPLASCAGYEPPVGLPITLMLDEGWPNAGPVEVAEHRFSRADGTRLEHCVFDRTTYTSPVFGETSWGRSALQIGNGVVLIPRAPLVPGEGYEVDITINGRAHRWSFRIASAIDGR